MENRGNGVGKFIAGLAVGVGIGVLFAPKSGAETRKELKEKFDELVEKVKKLDAKEVKEAFLKKISEIKKELSELDKEKVLAIAKEKAEAVKAKLDSLVSDAKAKATPVIQKTVNDLRTKTINVLKDTVDKLEDEQSPKKLSKKSA